MSNILLHGIAKLDLVGFSRTKSYDVWCSMLDRCYSKHYHAKRPTYIGCTVCPEWLFFSSFNEWFDSNHVEGYSLDKDILVQGNKVYSPENCVFVPSHINQLLVDRGRSRGEWPIGVNFEKRKNKFKACIGIRGKVKHLGYFDDAETAHLAWALAKKNYVRECANEAFFKGEISEKVCYALVNRKFE